ncbi:hypothetical protein BU16DRAFT_525850 [Lophium mytilinum]|uniref:Uncharacterized protein n=1 Tax=Lophium mytilinum TaxID=390894 RepID=A0A6A6QX22_9PEZI|nr:hypothetical protein BU16DRAFT_525850 [Lophium mytilinum]
MPQHALKRRKLNSANRLPVTVPATPRLNRGHPLQQVSLASPEATGPIAQGEGEGSNRLAPSQRAGRPSPFAPAGFNDEVENYVNDDGEAGDEDDDGSTNTLPRPSYLFDPYENDSVGLSSTLPRATAHQANHPNRLLRPSLPNMAHRSPGPQFYRNSNALFNTRASGAPTSRPNYAMGFSRAAALQDLSRMSQAEILLYLELAERERMGFGRQ